ncbi:glycosyltransferase [Micromonospora sp. C51]|uniref:glycosyltransferase family 2 protein n=1 Tax=Micromonospora sp. C51 TaxID=2824879 RepID=UPI001B379825|nr:glycosyltransferase [Micromonospora sp. C51]MBQ1048018.1 glycosyltransferase [Micromonospora sp. C51]
MNAPDVTVVVAVYNTMPYVTTCLESLVGQSIGLERLEVVAVDDGSTDGSGEELDRFAKRYPGTVTVLHQPNSGGPAGPSNRALDVAQGRYVFFIGSDDHLGPEALERLVDAADRWGSDVVLGRMVGTNNRYVHQAIYASTEEQVDLFDSALPWSMSNTKLFRRELIERYGLRFREDMRMGSDQPFTLEACVRAGRISVLADYVYYYAVKRDNAQNITYASRFEERLRCAEELINFVAGLIEPGPRRDAVLVRHFSWEVAKLLRADFLDLDPSVQERSHQRIRWLAESFLTDAIRDQLAPDVRLRLVVARHGSLEQLRGLIRQQSEKLLPALTVDGDRCFAGYVGFRDPELDFPDEWYDVTDRAAKSAVKTTVTDLAWSRDAAGGVTLVITAHNAWARLADLSGDAVRVSIGEQPAVVSLRPDGGGTLLRAEFPVKQLLAAGAQRWKAGAKLSVFGGLSTVPLRAKGQLTAPRQAMWRGLRLHRVTANTDRKHQVLLTLKRVRYRQVAATRLARLRPSRGK